MLYVKAPLEVGATVRVGSIIEIDPGPFREDTMTEKKFKPDRPRLEAVKVGQIWPTCFCDMPCRP